MFTQIKEFNQLHPIIRFLLFGTLITKAAKSMTTPFLAIYLHTETGLGFGLIGLIIGMGYFASTVGGIIGGTLSDKIGRKKVMLSSIFLWSIVFFLFGIAHELIWFLVLNILNGLCHSFFEPVSKALMADLSESTIRLRIFSLRYLAINIGAAIGPLVGTYLGLVASATPFIITGIVYLCYAISLCLMLQKVVLQVTEPIKKKFQLNLVWKTLKADVCLRFYVAGGIFLLFSYSQMESTLLQYLNESFTKGVKVFSTLITLNAVTVISLQMPLTKLFERYKPLTTISVGALFCILGNVGFAFSNEWFTFLVSMFVLTLGEILCFPSMNVLLDELAPDNMRGAYYGVQNFYNIGEFLGPWLGGIILGLYGGKVIFLTAAFSILLALCAYRIGRTRYLSIEKPKHNQLVEKL
ncbi:MDR family MFS transporter [Priestia filamentosa]|uniref:MDR family MFS transporter n=1 Tax=Priestia filamentosa TaxID=1402861 RepID=UPI003982CF16